METNNEVIDCEEAGMQSMRLKWTYDREDDFDGEVGLNGDVIESSEKEYNTSNE